MRFTINALLSLAAASAAMSSGIPQNIRTRNEVVRSLQRDSTGMGFAYIGPDNVARTYDADFEVVDAAPLGGQSDWTRSPDISVFEALKQAQARSMEQTSTPRERSVMMGQRQEKSCVSENCTNDNMCKGLSIYGYNCSYCLIVDVRNNIGNCQT